MDDDLRQARTTPRRSRASGNPEPQREAVALDPRLRGGDDIEATRTGSPSFPRRREPRATARCRCPGPPLARGRRTTKSQHCWSHELLPQQVVVKVAPVRVLALDQFELPRPAPFLDPLFTQDRFRHRFVKLGIDQLLDAMVSSEAGDLAAPDVPKPGARDRALLRHRASRCAGSPGCRRKDAARSFGAAIPGSPLSRGRR